MIICLGMYIPLFSVDHSPLFITELDYRFFCLFIGLSIILSVYNIKKQLVFTSEFNRSVIDSYTEKNMNMIIHILHIIGILLLAFVGFANLLLGFLLLVINLILLNSNYYNMKNSILCFIVEITFALILFICGYIYALKIINFEFFSVKVLLLLIPYIILYLSIYIISEILNSLLKSNSVFLLNNINSQKIVSILVFLLSGGLILGIRLNDPLSSICICISLPFFFYALFRNLIKDFQRAFVYPLFIVNFFIITIFPYLAIPSLVLFWIGKYYNWHKFDYNFPTFLVDSD